MNREFAVKVADAILYEGYMLYPYRGSALKNHQRWSFGVLYPQDYEEVRNGTERSFMHAEFVLLIKANCKLKVNLRFLHLRCEKAAIYELASESNLELGSDTRAEGVPRSIEFECDLRAALPQRFPFTVPVSSDCVQNQSIVANAHDQLQGVVIVNADRVHDELLKVSIEVRNETNSLFGRLDRDSALHRSMLSAHLILVAEGAGFVSLLDPPVELSTHVSTCRNVGNFPVLVGCEGDHDMMLCSPIILYDYPQVASESAGDFYDCTEMDEMLTLRVLTLTDQEKTEMRSAGEHTRNLLERTERSAREQLIKTHGAIRSLRPVNKDNGLES